MARHRHFVVEKLSADARAIVRDCEARNESAAKMIEDILEQTGETVAHSSLSRYLKWSRADKRRREMLIAKAEAGQRVALQHGAQLTDSTKAEFLSTAHQLSQDDDLRNYSPVALMRIVLAIEENQRKDRELALKTREADLTERKVAALEEKVRQAEEKEAKAKEVIANSAELSEETKRRIRKQIYGLD